MCEFCSKYWKTLPDYERHIISETDDRGYTVVSYTRIGDIENIKFSVKSEHWDTERVKVFNWKFCLVCGKEPGKE